MPRQYTLAVTFARVPAARRNLLGCALLASVACLVYWPALTGGFLWDDNILLTGSPLVKAADGLYRMWFTTEPMDYWPVTNSSFWIEWRLWGMNPVGYHATNLILHIANATVAWAILRQLRIPGAFVAALIFVVHPVNVESVAWIAQRKNTLSMLFFLLSIRWYLRYDDGPPAPGRTRWYGLSLLAFALAMLSKGSVVVLPAILLLFAWWQRGVITRSDAVRTVPFFLFGAALTLVNMWVQSYGAPEVVREATLVERALGAGAVVWFYLWKAVVPVHLAFVYPQWTIEVSDIRWWIPLLAASVVTGLLLWTRNTAWGRPALFAWAFYGLALAPVMGFVDVYFMKYSLVADHYQYIAVLSVCACAGALLERGVLRLAADRMATRESGARPRVGGAR